MLGKQYCIREEKCVVNLKDTSDIPLQNLWSLTVCLVQKGVMEGEKLLQTDQHNCADFVSQFISFLLGHRGEQSFRGALSKLLA